MNEKSEISEKRGTPQENSNVSDYNARTPGRQSKELSVDRAKHSQSQVEAAGGSPARRKA